MCQLAGILLLLSCRGPFFEAEMTDSRQVVEEGMGAVVWMVLALFLVILTVGTAFVVRQHGGSTVSPFELRTP